MLSVTKVHFQRVPSSVDGSQDVLGIFFPEARELRCTTHFLSGVFL